MLAAEYRINSGASTVDNITFELRECKEDGCSFGDISLLIQNEAHTDHSYLNMEKPLRVFFPVTDHPRKITAMYMFNEWWTRPAFIEQLQDIPEDTQVLFFQYPDRYVCFVPMVGRQFKTKVMGGTGTELCLEMTACMGGQSEIKEPLYVAAEAPALQEAIRKVFFWLSKKKGIRMREKRRVPEPFRYLGWCSWDACYTDVTEEKIRQKAEEFVQKDVPVRWMLIDDGWLSTKDQRLCSFLPDTEKFPDGFRTMTEDIRAGSQIQWFGVWHALAGYWGGIDPDSALAAREAPCLCKTVKGTVLPSPSTGERFYRDWYEILRQEGIDFVKVDCQSAVPYYFENSMAVGKAARGIHRALEDGASCFDGAIINCMGMAMENIAERPVSAVSRNSDDFMPGKEGGFAEHLIENAYNALYHNELYCCDWDMFWTNHPDCLKHSLLRAISGGPVYFSDRIGETSRTVLKPLVYQDGSLLMMSRSAKPTSDCVFSDPMKCGVLKLHNAAPWGGDRTAGGIAVYNLTGMQQDFTFSPADIPELEIAERYWVFDFFAGKVCSVGREELCRGTAKKDDFFWFVLLPQTGLCSCLGLIEKYVGFTAVESVVESKDRTIAVIHASGTLAWLAERTPKRVFVDTEEMTGAMKKEGVLYTVALTEKHQKTVLELQW